MTLLLDQNLSHRLGPRLAGVFAGVSHVRDHGLAQAEDAVIWRFAISPARTIATKDRDFQQRSLLLGHPPKVVWLRVGNAGTDDIEAFMKAHAASIQAFETDPATSLLVLP